LKAGSRTPRSLDELVRLTVKFRRSNKRTAIVSGVLAIGSLIGAALLSTGDAARTLYALVLLFSMFAAIYLVTYIANYLPPSFTLTERTKFLLWEIQQTLNQYDQQRGFPTKRRLFAQRSRWRLRQLSLLLTDLGLATEQRKRYDLFVHDRTEFVRRLKDLLLRVNYVLRRLEPLPEKTTDGIGAVIRELEASQSKLTSALDGQLSSALEIFGGAKDDRVDEDLSFIRTIDARTIFQTAWSILPQLVRFALVDLILLATYWTTTAYLRLGIDDNTRFSGGMILLAGLAGSQILVTRKS